MDIGDRVKDQLFKIKPRSVVYLFSGGKDSSLALLLTRDFVYKLCSEIECKTYILYVYITGNTHPLNAYASYSIMLWHKKHYGFEIIVRAYSELFQQYMAKYGLQRDHSRWCYTLFKEKLFIDVQKRLPEPQLLIDGMAPHDSKHRSEMVKAELELIERCNKIKYYAWHPLFNLNLSSEEKLKILEQHEEFKPVVNLYREFGDSLNCVICPYKSIDKMLLHNTVEDLSSIYCFIREALSSKRAKRKFSKLMNKTLYEYIS